MVSNRSNVAKPMSKTLESIECHQIEWTSIQRWTIKRRSTKKIEIKWNKRKIIHTEIYWNGEIWKLRFKCRLKDRHKHKYTKTPDKGREGNERERGEEKNRFSALFVQQARMIINGCNVYWLEGETQEGVGVAAKANKMWKQTEINQTFLTPSETFKHVNKNVNKHLLEM